MHFPGTTKNHESRATLLEQASSYSALPLSDASFPSAAILGSHTSSNYRSQKMIPGAMFWKKQMCEFCGKYLASRKGLRAHKKFHCKALKCSGSGASSADLKNETTPDEIILNSCYNRRAGQLSTTPVFPGMDDNNSIEVQRLEDAEDPDGSGDASDEGMNEDEASDNAFQCSLCEFSCQSRGEMISHMEVHWGMADDSDDDDEDQDSSSDSLPEDTSGYPFGNHTSDELYRLARNSIDNVNADDQQQLLDTEQMCDGKSTPDYDAEFLKAKLTKELFSHKGNGRKTLDELFPAPMQKVDAVRHDQPENVGLDVNVPVALIDS